jgi:hypothetical protein
MGRNKNCPPYSRISFKTFIGQIIGELREDYPKPKKALELNSWAFLNFANLSFITDLVRRERKYIRATVIIYYSRLLLSTQKLKWYTALMLYSKRNQIRKIISRDRCSGLIS